MPQQNDDDFEETMTRADILAKAADEMRSDQQRQEPLQMGEDLSGDVSSLRNRRHGPVDVVEKNPELAKIIQNLNEQNSKHETHRLPSRGLLNSELGSTGGEVRVRGMIGKDERIILNPRIMRSGQASNELIRACVQGVDPMKLTVPDRVFLLYVIRGITYGVDYPFSVTCPECGSTWSSECNIDDLPVVELNDNATEPINERFPISDLPFSYRYERGADEAETRKFSDFTKKMPKDAQIERTLKERVIRVLVDVAGFRDKTEIEAIWDNLSEGDRVHFRNLLNEPGFGIKTEIDVQCQFCDHEFETSLPMGADFFFPPRIKKRS